MGDATVLRPQYYFPIPSNRSATTAAWSPDGKYLAVADVAQRFHVLEIGKDLDWRTHGVSGAEQVTRIRWAPDGQHLALVLARRGGVLFVKVATGALREVWREGGGEIIDVAWSSSGKEVFGLLRGSVLVSRDWASPSRTVRRHLGSVLKATTLEAVPGVPLLAVMGSDGDVSIFNKLDQPMFRYSGRRITGVAFSPNGTRVAFWAEGFGSPVVLRLSLQGVDGTFDGVALEGHASPLSVLGFTADHRLVTCDGSNMLIAWDLDRNAPVATAKLGGIDSDPEGAAARGFSPGCERLAVMVDPYTVRVYDLSTWLLERTLHVPTYVSSISAKVVIAGEPRVGKTSLAQRIAEDRYAEHEATHGVKLWQVPPERLSADSATPEGQRREVVLWDLGGQEEYRLVHQLFLRDTTVALVLFDPMKGRLALDEVEAWDKRLVKHARGQALRKLLVATKCERNDPIDLQSIEQARARGQYEGYFRTSAKEGNGLPDLKAAITRAIDWSSLVTVHRPELFQRVRDEIERRRAKNEVVLPVVDLQAAVRNPSSDESDEAAVDAVVRQLCLQGAIAETRDSGGVRNLVLQIGEVERYAGSLILLARDHPAGVPAVEKSFLAGYPRDLPRIPTSERLPFREERWVLECVIQLLLENGIAVEHAGLFVFPALFRRTEALAGEVPTASSIFYEFSGAIDNIYSSLVAALALSRKFGHMRLWEDRAEFEAADGTVCGLQKVDRTGGVAHLDVYFGPAAPQPTRNLFLCFVQEHLAEHGVELVERLDVVCQCGYLFDEAILRERLSGGKNEVTCLRCDRKNAITPGAEATRAADTDLEQRIRVLRDEVARGRKQSVERARELIPSSEPAPAVGPARILHLSDLHVSASDDVDAMAEPLLADLRLLGEEQGLDQVDYLVISGDVTEHATPEELRRAFELVSRLIERLKLSSRRCIIVPGNHDLSWAEKVYRLEEDAPGSFDPSRHVQKEDVVLVRDDEAYPKRFRSFSTHFFHLLMQREYPLGYEEQGMTAFFPEHGLQFLMLNSSWEIDRHFRTRSGVHSGSLERSLKRANDELRAAREQNVVKRDTPITRLAVWHHPVTGNDKIANDAFLERLRQEGFRMCLHGHVHEVRADLIAYTDPVRSMHSIGAGSFGAIEPHRPESTPRLYNVIEISPDHQWVRVHTRARPRNGGAWGTQAIWPGDRRDEKRGWYQVRIEAPFLVRAS